MCVFFSSNSLFSVPVMEFLHTLCVSPIEGDYVQYVDGCSCKTVYTQHPTSPKSTKSRNSDCSVSHGTNPEGDFGLFEFVHRNFEFVDLVDLMGGGVSVESVMGCLRLVGSLKS